MQGGGGRFPYPKWVWSPAGGWWGQPKNWKANFAVVGGVIGAIAYQAFQYSSANEVRFLGRRGIIPAANTLSFAGSASTTDWLDSVYDVVGGIQERGVPK